MPTIAQLPKILALDAAASPYAGAKAYWYVTNTTTPKNTYTDYALTTPAANPVVADANGVFAPMFLANDERYRLTLKTSADVLIYTVDDVAGPIITQAELGAILYPRTAAEISAGVTPTNYAYAPDDIRRLGAVCDGSTDDTTAIRNAYLVGGAWKVPAGAKIRITGTLTGVRATRIYSDSPITPAPPGSAAATQAFLIHDFNGTFFDLVGDASDDKIGAGFAFERITFLQNNGNGTGASGTCIRAYSTTQRCPWLRLTNCNIEQGAGKNDFTWNIDIDGTAVAIPNNNRDIFFSRMRLVAGTNATGAMRLAGVANVFMHDIEANLSKADLLITGTDATHLCQNIVLNGTSWNNINLDWVTGLSGAGNNASTVTATANTTDVNLGCDSGGSAPSVSLATRTTICGREGASGKYVVRSTNNTRFEMGANTAEHSGPVASDTAFQAGTNPATAGAFRMPNGANLAARNAANNANVNIAQVDGANRVQLSPDGAPLVWIPPIVALGGGAAATLGTIGGSGPATAAQFKWVPIVLSDGSSAWFPAWK